MTNTAESKPKFFDMSKFRETKLTNAKIKKWASKSGIMILRYILIISLAFMILYPLLRMISTSITHPRAVGMVGSLWIPTEISLNNLRVAAAIMHFSYTLPFTLINVAFITFLQIFNAAFAGYAFARLRFRGMGILFVMVLLTFIIPRQAFRLPQHILFRNFDVFGIVTAIRGEPFNLLNQTHAIFILAGLGMGISGGLFIFIFRQFFRGLPKELEETAYVDRAGFFRTFFSIVLRMAKPAFLTVGTLSFIWNYNDLHFPSLFNPINRYLQMRIHILSQDPGGGITRMQQWISASRGRMGFDVVVINTPMHDGAVLVVCSLLAIVPLILLFLIIQKQFVEGVERSGIVG